MTDWCLNHPDRVCWPCQSVIAVFTRVGTGAPFWRELAWAHDMCVCAPVLACAEAWRVGPEGAHAHETFERTRAQRARNL